MSNTSSLGLKAARMTIRISVWRARVVIYTNPLVQQVLILFQGKLLSCTIREKNFGRLISAGMGIQFKGYHRQAEQRSNRYN
jgi:hypothetical protein